MLFHPFSGLQGAQGPFADGGPDQPQRREADFRRHPAHLAVFAFVDREFDPVCRDGRAKTDRRGARPQAGRVVDEAQRGRAGDEITEVDATAQRLQRGIVGSPLDLRPVGFRQFVRGSAMRLWSGPSSVKISCPSLSASNRPAAYTPGTLR